MPHDISMDLLQFQNIFLFKYHVIQYTFNYLYNYLIFKYFNCLMSSPILKSLTPLSNELPSTTILILLK
jgi:hypothetical protein